MMLQKKTHCTNFYIKVALFVFVLLFSDKLHEYQITWTARRGLDHTPKHLQLVSTNYKTWKM